MGLFASCALMASFEGEAASKRIIRLSFIYGDDAGVMYRGHSDSIWDDRVWATSSLNTGVDVSCLGFSL